MADEGEPLPITPAAPPPPKGNALPDFLTAGAQGQRNPYSPAGQAPYSGPSAVDTLKAWANWRLAQLPDVRKFGEETANWDWRTQPRPQGPETAKLDESMVGGGPIGLNAPGGFAGILKAPLTKTKVKYEHPITGEEPTRVFHGTPTTFEHFDPSHVDPQALYGPGYYFTEESAVASGYAKTKPGAEPRAAAPQVRPAHLDIHKPFDINKEFSKAEIDRLDDATGYSPRVAERPRVPGPTAQSWEWAVGGQSLWDAVAHGPTGENLYRVLESRFGGRDRVNRALHAAGFDGITHIGGALTGTDPHRVWIAFDPKQVHSPFEYASPKPLAPPKPKPEHATK